MPKKDVEEYQPSDPDDPGAELLQENMDPCKLAKREKRKLPLPKQLHKYMGLLGQKAYLKTQDGWYVLVTIRDMRWSFGRIDFLAEQGTRVAWVKSGNMFLPPGTARLRKKGGSVKLVIDPPTPDTAAPTSEQPGRSSASGT